MPKFAITITADLTIEAEAFGGADAAGRVYARKLKESPNLVRLTQRTRLIPDGVPDDVRFFEPGAEWPEQESVDA